MSFASLACVFVGGGIGACLRWFLARWSAALGITFDAGIVAANLLGCFVIGVVAAWIERHGVANDNARLFIMTGVLGGFTTFSTFSLEALNFFRTSPAAGLGYVLAQVALCLLASYGGYLLVLR